MSNWSGGGDRHIASKGWRGKQSAAEVRSPDWQSRPAGPVNRVPSNRSLWQSHWLLYTAVGSLLLCGFLYLILSRPAKTPVLYVMGSYQGPMPPNRWADEDRKSLEKLGTTIVTPINKSWLGNESEGLKEFANLLTGFQKTHRGFRPVREPLVVYFSMPGAVNEKGDPCLIPPGASPFRSAEWLKISTIVEKIDELIPDTRAKLVVFDSNQELINWKLGIVYNTFGERLRQYVETCGVEKLAVLTAASEGQRSWASPDLEGTAFGQFLCLALAGAADHQSSKPNRVVELSELEEYLQSSVGNWSRSCRGIEQRPAVIRSKPGLDFPVTYALRNVDSYRESLVKSDFVTAVKPEQIGNLWQHLDTLRNRDLVRFDPLAFARFEHDLLRLEQLADAGSEYAKSATNLFEDISKQLEDALAATESETALPGYWSATRRDGIDRTRFEGELSSLPLRSYFGLAEDTGEIKKFWETLTLILNGLDLQNAPLEPHAFQKAYCLPETHILLATYQQQATQGSKDRLFSEILALRATAERLAVPFQGSTDTNSPGDERAHYYVRQAIKQAESNRALLEDSIFLEPDDPLRDKLLADTRRLYARAEAVNKDVSRAFAVLDRSLAELPYIAAWACGPEQEGFRDSANSVKQLSALIRATHELGESLNQLGQVTEIDDLVTSVVANSKTIEASLNSYRDDINRMATKLKTGDPEDVKELLDLEVVLASPLVAPDLRAPLLEKRRNLSALLHMKYDFSSEGSPAIDKPAVDAASDRHAEQQSAKPSSGETAPQRMEIASVIDSWSESPLLELVSLGENSPPPDKGDVLDRLDEFNARARNRLLELQEFNVTGAVAGSVGNDGDYLVDRMALCRAERQIRAAAGLGIQPPRVDAVAQLRWFDLQQLAIWHTQRALDGFWHAVADAEADNPREMLQAPSGRADRPLFATAAEEYLRVADRLSTPILPSVQAQFESLKRLIEQRVRASEHGVIIGGETRAIFDPPTDVEVEVEIAANEEGPNFPPGKAALYLTNGTGEAVEVYAKEPGWGEVALPIIGEAHSRSRAHDVRGALMDANIFFRGRRYVQEMQVRSLSGTVVEYELPKPDRQSITLLGDKPKDPSIVFILDCSASMSATIETEIGTRQSLMDIAKGALADMLDKLSNRRTARTGVIFFGHRLGWVKDTWTLKPNEAAVPKGQKIPRDLVPGTDVETIVALGNFDARQYGTVSERLANVGPLGVTPVNLAIIQALNQFGPKDVGYTKSIVVITDGENKQDHPPSGFGDLNPTSTEAVLNAWRNNGLKIPVYIVGFGIPKGAGANAVRQFTQIADETGGDFVPADTRSDLIKSLQERLDVNGYVVRLVEGQGRRTISGITNGEETPVAIGTPVPVPRGAFPLQAEVQFQTSVKQVVLEGGETLQMRVRRDSDDIGPDIFRVPGAEKVRLVSTQPQPLITPVLQIHPPTRVGGKVNFRFSLQDVDSHFTQRPLEVWAQASTEDGKNSYVFYDRVFDPGLPVPTVSFTAPNWPQEAKRARIHFWCTYQSVEPVLSVHLNTLPRYDSSSAAFVPVSQVDGLEVRTAIQDEPDGGYRVIVEERHAKKIQTIGAVRVRLIVDDKSLGPAKVSHQFDPTNGLALHVFTFSTDLNREEFAKRVTIDIARGDMLKEVSLGIDKIDGQVVDVVEGSPSLQPNVAGSAAF